MREEFHDRTRRAADLGDPEGQYSLAQFYEECDLEQAAFWYRKAALQGNELALKKCRELSISLAEPKIDREAIRKALKCRLFPLNTLPFYKYAVICSFYQGKWLLSRHKKRDTWETQGGHIEEGETPLECARRELYEESGIRDAVLFPVCDYWGFNQYSCSNGQVFLAVVHALGDLPESEMKEVRLFDTLPENLTYPQTSPLFFQEARSYLEKLDMGDGR